MLSSVESRNPLLSLRSGVSHELPVVKSSASLSAEATEVTLSLLLPNSDSAASPATKSEK